MVYTVAFPLAIGKWYNQENLIIKSPEGNQGKESASRDGLVLRVTGSVVLFMPGDEDFEGAEGAKCSELISCALNRSLTEGPAKWSLPRDLNLRTTQLLLIQNGQSPNEVRQALRECWRSNKPVFLEILYQDSAIEVRYPIVAVEIFEELLEEESVPVTCIKAYVQTERPYF